MGWSNANKLDMSILVHKCEGRLFLTDRNGFYNELLVEMQDATQSHTNIILTHNRSALLQNEKYLISDDISILALKGD